MGKYCVVPKCKNTTNSTPEKIFFCLPRNKNLRNRWTTAMKRKGRLSEKSCNLHVCADHFSLKDDCGNYLENQLMGTRLKLREGAVPHLFECQGLTSKNIPVEVLEQERRRLVDEALRNASEPKHQPESTVKTYQQVKLTCRKLGVSKSPKVTDCLQIIMDFSEEQLSGRLTRKEDNDSDLCPRKGESCADNVTNLKPNINSVGACVTCEDQNPSIKLRKLDPGIILKEQFTQLRDRSPINQKSTRSSSNFSTEVGQGTEEKWKQKCSSITLQRILKRPMVYLGLPDRSFPLVEHFSLLTQLELSHILLALKKIKLNESFPIVSKDFGFSERQGRRIFKRTLPILAESLKELLIWPERRNVQTCCPIFSHPHGRIEAIIELLEIRVEKPTSSHHRLSRSKKKSCTTVKYLISCTLDKQVNFISDGYGGKISNSSLLKDCGFLERLSPGCIVMADRVLKDIAPLVESHGCTLITHSIKTLNGCFKDKVTLMRQISASRKIIRRVIRRLRSFEMLKLHAVIEAKLISSLDCIIKIACSIANIQYHFFID